MPRSRWLIVLVLCAGTPLLAQGTIDAPAEQVPVLYDADVVVVGGGLSGVGAALGAARGGAKTVVIERTGFLGGWIRGTGLGNVMAIKGWRPALSEGVLLDITKKMVDLHAEGYPDVQSVLDTGRLYVNNMEVLPYAFQSLVTEAKAKVLYFCTYSQSIVKDGKISAVIVQSPSGRGAVRGKIFIDCTGLATVAAESGATIKRAETSMGLACWIGGVDVEAFNKYQESVPKLEKPKRLHRDPAVVKWVEQKIGRPLGVYKADGSGDMDFPWDDWVEDVAPMLGPKFREAVDRGELPLFYRVGKRGTVSFTEGLKVTEGEVRGGVARPRTYVAGVDPANIEELSEAHEKSVEYLFKFVAFLNKNMPGFEKAQIVRIADQTLNRAGRSVQNDVSLTRDEAAIANQADDVICVLKRGQEAGEYEVPYRAMVPEKIDNLLAVGKSSSGGMAFRTHMLSVIMGQAAGTAAAVAVKEGVSAKNVNIRKVQAELRKAGIPLPEK
jgi:hypothetical protein